MKTALQPRLVNGPAGDPALFVDILRERRALLFDCGQLHVLAAAELLRISDVFVSHAHIDHFIGFDHLLRLQLGRRSRVRVFGPPGIRDCVGGKLSGYTWNLLHSQRLVFEVHELGEDEEVVTEFACRRRFRPTPGCRQPRHEPVLRDDLLEVRAALLDHRIPSVAYAVRERDFYNVDPVALEATGHRAGPWLGRLKDWARAGRPEDARVEVEGKLYPARELADALLLHSPGHLLAYAADALGSPQNRSRLCELARGADLLYCEGAFLHEDLERARETYHLTARQAGEIAREAGARRLVVFHHSPKYEGRFQDLEAEAERAFRGEAGAGDSPPEVADQPAE
ncbi:MAG TPA: MBL fold metallo-hydrolase [Myxococcota bacterium]|nr:MBL fold metallo-hydrolase [Myxococcota bacterium]HRY91921.1 MBL fold metallo-hydrolase [Myxococcota bacterium]HSA21105.1 MBL fold metallo-hydrolase [Myxococcota bacterium]